MKKTIILLLILSMLVSLTACSDKKFKNATKDEIISTLLDNMSIEDKVGQLLMFSIPGTKINDAVEQFLYKARVGNVILYADNIADSEQVKKFNADLQTLITANTEVPAFISVDQEGGLVTRIYKGATYFPSPMSFAAAGNAQHTQTAGEYMGQELRYMGFSMNLAPSVDINSNPDNPIIGTRTYGDTVETVNTYSEGFIKGLQSQKIVACAKHFPGHGDTNIDSHYSLPVIDKPLSVLESNEFATFKNAVGAGADAIMTAHIFYPQIEQDGLPATMSRTLLTDILRTKMGYKGLIITDSMNMAAITDKYSMGVASVTALKAGADIVLVGGAGTTEKDLASQLDAYNAIVSAVKDGTIDLKTLYDKVRRVLEVKAKYGLLDSLSPNYEPEKIKVDWDAHKDFAEKVSQSSITVVRGAENLPINSYDTLVVTTEARIPLSDNKDNPNSVGYYLSTSMGGDHITIDLNPDTARINEVLSVATRYANHIICTENILAHPGQADLVNQLITQHPSTVVVAMQSPYDIRLAQNASTYICTYEYTPNSVQSVINVITGKVKATGKLPIKLY